MVVSSGVESEEGLTALTVFLFFFPLPLGAGCVIESDLKSTKSTTGRSDGPLAASSATISDQVFGVGKRPGFPADSSLARESGLLLLRGVGRWMRSFAITSSVARSVSESSDSDDSDERSSSSSGSESEAASRSISSSLSSSPLTLPRRLMTRRFFAGAVAGGSRVADLAAFRADGSEVLVLGIVYAVTNKVSRFLQIPDSQQELRGLLYSEKEGLKDGKTGEKE